MLLLWFSHFWFTHDSKPYFNRFVTHFVESLPSLSFSSLPSSSITSTKKPGIIKSSSSEAGEEATSLATAASNTSQRYQTNKRGHLKHLFEPDCLKLAKETTTANPTSPSPCHRIKANLAVKRDQLIAEYCGYAMLANEQPQQQQPTSTDISNNNNTNSDTKHSFNPFQVLYAIDSEHKIRVDAVHMGNLSRYMRRSCQANCTLDHAFDTNGEVHLLVRARSDITKGQELTLPFDFEQEDAVPTVLTKDTHGFCVCNCQRDRCPLRDALDKEKAKEAAGIENELHSQPLKVETKVEPNQLEETMTTTSSVAASATTTTTATNADLVKKKSPGVKRAEKKEKQQQQSLGHEEHDELNKSLVRPDFGRFITCTVRSISKISPKVYEIQ